MVLLSNYNKNENQNQHRLLPNLAGQLWANYSLCERKTHNKLVLRLLVWW